MSPMSTAEILGGKQTIGKSCTSKGQQNNNVSDVSVGHLLLTCALYLDNDI